MCYLSLKWDDEWDTAALEVLMIVQGIAILSGVKGYKLLDSASAVLSKSSSRLFVCQPSALYNALAVYNYSRHSVMSSRWSDKVGVLLDVRAIKPLAAQT